MQLCGSMNCQNKQDKQKEVKNGGNNSLNDKMIKDKMMRDAMRAYLP